MDRSAAEVRFRRVFDDHYVSILRYFIRRIGHEDAPDATDEVFLVVWRRLDRLPPEPETLPWLYGIARRVLANHERGARRRVRLGAKLIRVGAVRPPSIERLVEARLDAEVVRAALSTLSARDQEVLRLSAWDGLSHTIIAGLLGCSTNAVAVRLHRAMRHLAKAIEDAGHSRVNQVTHVTEGDER